MDTAPIISATPTQANVVSVERPVPITTTNFRLQIKTPLERLSKADPANVQEVIASQIDLMSVYHNEVIDQARKSFRSAWIVAIAGFAFFLLAIALFLIQQSQNVALLSAISGGIIEVISAINFYLYRKAFSQMANFQSRLDVTQRFMLANSICEGLQGETKQQVRSELVRVIAGIPNTAHERTPQDLIQSERTPTTKPQQQENAL